MPIPPNATPSIANNTEKPTMNSVAPASTRDRLGLARTARAQSGSASACVDAGSWSVR